MTNYETLTDDEKKIMMTNPWGMDKITDKIIKCGDMPCVQCKFKSDACNIVREKWLNEQITTYQIPRDTPIDTKVLVSCDGHEWRKSYFSGCFTPAGDAYVFRHGATSWSNCSDVYEWFTYCNLAKE